MAHRGLGRLLAQLRFDGRKIPVEEGDTIASALHRAGVRVLSRSMKYHRPRGLYCNTGSCASCFVEVDGKPNVPACMQPAAGARTVRSQNRLGTAKRDLLGVVDKVYPDGFDPHDAFTFPGLVNKAFVKAVRLMSGWGRAPPPGTAPDDAPVRRTRHVDHLIIGAGRGGLAAAMAAARGEGDVLVVEEMPDLGGPARWVHEPETDDLVEDVHQHPEVEVWTDALAFGIYDHIVAVRRGRDLWELTADHITIAPGRHDGQAVFPNNDLPGILTLRGAQRLWYVHNVLPGRRIAVHGELAWDFRHALEKAGAEIVVEGEITEARGGTEVQRVRVEDTWHACDCAIVDVPGVPRIELFQQAGCDMAWQDALVPAGERGETSIEGIRAALPARPAEEGA